MARRRKLIIAAGAAASVLVAVVFVSVFTRAPYLVLTNDNTGALLLRHRVSEGYEFSISFIHSVNISPVTEIYQIHEGRIVLTAAEFETFGAGMPTEPGYGQTLTNLPEGGLRLDGIDRVMDELRYMIGYTTEHTLVLQARQIPLDTLDSAGQTVRFTVKHLAIWQRL